MAHSIGTPIFWTSFILVVLVLLSVDLGIFNRRAHAVTVKEALSWSIVWIILSLSFGTYIYTAYGKTARA